MNKYRILLEKFSNLENKILNKFKQNIIKDKNFIQFIKNTKDFTYTQHDGLLKLLEFEKVNGYYKDKYGKKISYNNISSLKSSGTELNLNILHLIEINKVKEDYKYFKRLYLKIPTKDGIARCEMREYQERLDDALLTGEDTLIFFSRQSGKTINASGFILWSAISRENSFNCGIVGNREVTAAEVLDKIKKIMIELPIWLSPCVAAWNKRSIEFENSTRIMTSRPHKDAFRGFTISLLYCDEVAYYKSSEWEDFKDSVFPTMNSLIKKQIIATSTAKGINHWSEMVEGARNGTNGYKIVENDWKEVPRYNKKGKLLTPEEYKNEIISKYGEIFFKSTEENSFMGSAKTLIDSLTLKNIKPFKKISIPEEIYHGINVYMESIENHSYVIGVDPAGDGTDNFALQVIDITMFPFIQVASAALDIDYMSMPEHINELAKYYNNAYVTVEINDGIGVSIANTLYYTYEYEYLFREKKENNKFTNRYGFRTTSKTRNNILSLMKTLIEEKKLIITCKNTLDELKTFEFSKTKNKYQASEGNKDDLVMSLAISLVPFMDIKGMDDHKLFLESIRKDFENEENDNEVYISDYMSILETSFSSDDCLIEKEDIIDKIKTTLNEDTRFEYLRMFNS